MVFSPKEAAAAGAVMPATAYLIPALILQRDWAGKAIPDFLNFPGAAAAFAALAVHSFVIPGKWCSESRGVTERKDPRHARRFPTAHEAAAGAQTAGRLIAESSGGRKERTEP